MPTADAPPPWPSSPIAWVGRDPARLRAMLQKIDTALETAPLAPSQALDDLDPVAAAIACELARAAARSLLDSIPEPSQPAEPEEA